MRNMALMGKERLDYFLFVLGVFVYVLQLKLINSLWLKYLLILFLAAFSTYFFFYKFLYTLIKNNKTDWFSIAISGLILSWTSGILILFFPGDIDLVLQLVKVCGILNYIFSFAIIFWKKEHFLAVIHFIIAVLISSMVYM
jgi:hypothetical protein